MTQDDQERPDDAVEPAADEPQRRQPATTQWWFAGGLRLVGGLAIAGMQYSVISTGEEVVFNWVLAVAGIAVALWGVAVLVQDRPKR